MPHYKNTKKNTTRKSNASSVSHSSTSTPSASDDDWSSNIKVKTSRHSTPKSVSSSPETQTAPPEEIQEPSPPEWETMGISEEEYWAMRQRVQQEMRQYALENFKRNMVNELDTVSYWERRLERYERMREPYNKKAGWSAVDVSTVEHIDACIQECHEQINSFQEED